MFGLGIDTVETKRCASWIDFSDARLQKLFTLPEIIQVRQQSYILAIQKIATHFAVKEAFFKALTKFLVKPIPFFYCSQQITLTHTPFGAPELILVHSMIQPYCAINVAKISPVVTITHTHNYTTACVLLVSAI